MLSVQHAAGRLNRLLYNGEIQTLRGYGRAQDGISRAGVQNSLEPKWCGELVLAEPILGHRRALELIELCCRSQVVRCRGTGQLLTCRSRMYI